jgi:hypothetical protein
MPLRGMPPYDYDRLQLLLQWPLPRHCVERDVMAMPEADKVRCLLWGGIPRRGVPRLIDLARVLQLPVAPKPKPIASAARALPGDATPLHCRGDKPGIRPGGRVTFFASPKKVTKKRRPGDRAPLTRGARVSGTRSGARLNSLRFATLRQTPHLFPLRAP